MIASAVIVSGRSGPFAKSGFESCANEIETANKNASTLAIGMGTLPLA
jgi:hypothetical protein